MQHIQKYNLCARIIHWLMAVLITANFVIGLATEKYADIKIILINYHKSIGVLIAIFLFLRIINKIASFPPSLPEDFSKNEKILIKLGHLMLYILMLLAPVSGYLMSSFSGYEVNFFNFFSLPQMQLNYELSKCFSIIHKYSAFSLIIVAFGHAIFALKHLFFDSSQKNLLKRII